MDTVKTWNEVFHGRNLAYSENPQNQNQLFDMVKIGFLKEIFPKGQNKMLEVGCGTAFVSLYFSKRGYETTCLDINQSILNVARQNFKKENAHGQFLVGDAEKLPFADNQFDVVCSFGLLEHFKDPQTAITEMARVLKPGGLFFADIVPNRFSVQSLGNVFNFFVSLFYGLIKLKPRSGWEKGIRNFRPLYFENSFSWKKYRSFMEQADIKNLQVRGNRPFPRLTLPHAIDKLYTTVLRLTVPLWKAFDHWDNPLSRFWGAGLWFWGYKS